LRAALSGSLPESELTSREMYEVLDLCMECKSCKAECASGVDMARIKAEFLHNYQSVHGVPLRSRFFGEIGLFLHLIQPFAGIVNFFLHRTAFRWLLDKTLGITRYRSLPTISSRSFRRWFAEHTTRAEGDPVLLFVDTFTNAYYPETGIAAVNVLEAAGYKVIVAKGQVCCGRPMISKGLLERARKMAERNLTVLTPFAEQGIPIIGLEPSCLVTLRDEYLEFFPDDWRSAAVAKAACMIDEFMVEPGDDGRRPMAGSFGYEREHYELSMKVGEMIVLPAVRKGVAEGAEIAASGVSCRAQILEGASILARHPIEFLADCIRTTD
jgi:Fe-S oxidoreductase